MLTPASFSRSLSLPIASQISGSRPGESPIIQRAVVTNNVDPDNLQRHIAATEGKAGQSISAPSARTLPAPYWSPPQFPIGSTCLLAAVEGDGHNTVAMGVELNAANPVALKRDPVLDDWRLVPGDSTYLVNQNWHVSVSESVRIESRKGGSSITLSPDGGITITGGSIALKGEVTVQGDLSVQGKAEIGGKDIAVTGAKDSAGHRIVDSGQ